jgi:hypothetical protein
MRQVPRVIFDVSSFNAADLASGLLRAADLRDVDVTADSTACVASDGRLLGAGHMHLECRVVCCPCMGLLQPATLCRLPHLRRAHPLTHTRQAAGGVAHERHHCGRLERRGAACV